MMINKEPIISKSWTGKSGTKYRTIRYWIGAGWSNTILQYEDDLLNWSFVI
jgi:hypothetical protein